MDATGTEYGTLIVGATCAGLGYACARPEDSLLVESSALVGWEFVEAMDPGSGWAAAVGLGMETDELRRELQARNILDGERVHLPAVAPVLFNRLKESGLPYRFWTDVLEVRDRGAEFEVVLFDAGGRRTVRVNRILDTTTHLVSVHEAPVRIESKAIGATLNRMDRPAPLPAAACNGGWRVQEGRFPGEAFLALALPPEADWPAARARLHEFWMDRPAGLRPWHLVAVGTRLAEKPAWVDSPSDRWQALPSARFENVLEAFAAGAAKAAECEALV
ncbi:MAG: hypothetical protein JXR37_32735 [Kiritimatiellae bacterium]|nr:hypothetical protein [Kiritimatiellia bacterium]